MTDLTLRYARGLIRDVSDIINGSMEYSPEYVQHLIEEAHLELSCLLKSVRYSLTPQVRGFSSVVCILLSLLSSLEKQSKK